MANSTGSCSACRATTDCVVQHLNYVYKTEPALWELDDTHEGFAWIDFHDADNSVVAFMRRSRGGDVIVFAVNATPLVRQGYRLGVPGGGFYREIISTDAETYGGSNVGNMGGFEAEDFPGRVARIAARQPSAFGDGCLQARRETRAIASVAQNSA